MGTEVSIVIVNYNVKYFLAQCLQSIFKSVLDDISLEVWVVDNASNDGSVDMIQQDFPKVKLIENKSNVGFAKANNQALQLIQSEFTLILNPDTILEENTLAQCVKFMRQHPDCGAMGVRMIDGSGTFLPESKRSLPSIMSSLYKLSHLSELFPHSSVFSHYHLGHLSEYEAHKIEVLCGAFMFIKHKILEETGFFDESFFMYGEDIDLSYRILQTGASIYYAPVSTIVHFKGESTKKASIDYHKHFYGAMGIYVEKHFSKSKATLFQYIIKLGIYFRAFISFIAYPIKALLLPMIDGVLIFFTLKYIAHWWAMFKFNDPSYYDAFTLYRFISGYTLTWLFGLWFFGRYSDEDNFKVRLNGILSGTIGILIIYALLPEYLRTSRAILVGGSVAAFIITSLTSRINKIFFKTHKNPDSSRKNIAIVTNFTNNETIERIKNSHSKADTNVYFIKPNILNTDGRFSGDLDSLHTLIVPLKINEIVFSSDDINMHQIIDTMSKIGDSVIYKISSDQSLSVLSSSNKASQGNILLIDKSFTISKGISQRSKRVFDMIASIFIILFSPILYVLNGLNANLFKNIIDVMYGKKTWVGYGGAPSDYINLPPLRQAVIAVPLLFDVVEYSKDWILNENKKYALEYSPWIDFNILIKHHFRLAN